MLKRTLLLLSSSLMIACSQSPTSPTAAAAAAQSSYNQPKQAAIASAHPLSTQAGMDILNQGGNAFDAAIAVAASLGVVEPYSAGIGGGGFWLIYQADKDRYTFIDAREKAPAAAYRDYYLDASGNVDRD
ncbi:MAG: gamma-glutamyltransferase, partial [Pseudomonadota bacterium]